MLFLLAYLGGVLTILSPCILPVLPFVFARAGQPFMQSSLPLLLGMALTFSAVALLATIGGHWAVAANEYGRNIALLLFALFGLSLLWVRLADFLTRPFVSLGERLSLTASKRSGSIAAFLLGIATGLLWTPCAGPILGLLLTTTAIQGANTHAWLLLLVYAIGSASALGLVLFAGERVFKKLKRSLGVEMWARRFLGVAVLAGVATIAVGADRGMLTSLSLTNTSQLEQSLLNRLQAFEHSLSTVLARNDADTSQLKIISDVNSNNDLPDLSGATTWLNTSPLNASALIGKVVLLDFWTYSCINCLRSLPYVRAWYEKYKHQGLIVIGVHTPEFAFEKIPENVRRAVHDLEITYPVALDNDYAIWRAMNNRYWPAHYFFDAQGRLRHSHFGEGDYAQSEQMIQTLLAERNGQAMRSNLVQVNAKGIQAAADDAALRSPETYIGYGFRQDGHFVARGGYAQDQEKEYLAPRHLRLNDWALIGKWRAQVESAILLNRGGRIVFRFQARDLHLVLGTTNDQSVRFRVTIDGAAPGADHGVDVDAQGLGVVNAHRLYQLIRQRGNRAQQEHTFEIEFLEPGVEAFSFTFG